MKSRNKKRIKNWLFQLELFSLIILALVLYALISVVNGVVLVKPVNGDSLTDLKPEFEWISRHNDYGFYLAKDSNFSDIVVEINLSRTKYKLSKDLDFGEYYWFVVAYDGNKEFKSSVRKFKIETLVDLEIDEYVRNAGNVEAKIFTKEKEGDNWVNTGASILDVNEILKKDQKSFTLYIAEQNE